MTVIIKNESEFSTGFVDFMGIRGRVLLPPGEAITEEVEDERDLGLIERKSSYVSVRVSHPVTACV